MPEAPCLRGPKALGEKIIRLVGKLDLFDRELKVQRVEDFLCVPLIREPSPTEIKEFKRNLLEFEISTHDFSERAKRPLKLLDVLEDKLPLHLLASVPHAIDFVGDIAVVEIPLELIDHKKTMGEAILKTHKRVGTVLAKSGAVEGIYRLREFEVIAGIEKMATVHREHGCIFQIDLAKAYFSPRLSHEHNRVASQVKEGETVVDMFAGIGSFSILIAAFLSRFFTIDTTTQPDTGQTGPPYTLIAIIVGAVIVFLVVGIVVAGQLLGWSEPAKKRRSRKHKR